MNELDLLKKHWQSSEQNLPKYSYDELYKMILKKSSSIVKWILIISIIEFAIWGGLYFLVPESSMEFNEEMGLKTPLLFSSIITLIVFITFIGIFYKNYTSIKITDSVKQLMERILRTRRTVYFFIIWNIATTTIGFLWSGYYFSQHREKLLDILAAQNPSSVLEHPDMFMTYFIVMFLFTATIIIALMLLLYRIVYIRLLKRLKNNYKQLKEIENNAKN